MQLAGAMPIWGKALLWIAVVLLPGGLLLAPIVLAFSHRERRRARAVPIGSDPLRASPAPHHE